MRTLLWKVAAVLIAGIFIESLGFYATPYLVQFACASLPVLAVLYWISSYWSPLQRLMPARRSIIFLLPAFLLMVAFLLPGPPGSPPDSWFQFDSDEPDYEHRFIAEATIEESINPGLYLAKVRILDFQKDLDTSYYGEDWSSSELLHPSGQRLVVSEHSFAEFRTALSVDNPDLYPGCKLSLQVYGRGVPEKPGGGFGKYLADRGANSYLRVYKKWHVLEQECPENLRSRIRNRLFTLLSELKGESAQVARAILLGESGWLGRDLKNRVRRLGVMHLFAASGLHLGIFYGVLYLPLSWKLGRKHPLALFLPLLPCAFYTWILYFPVSLCRAFIFILLLALRSLIHRKIVASHHLTNTFLILILWDPMGFFSISGYLSCGAVSGILLFYRRIEQSLFSAHSLFMRAIRAQLALSLSATMFIAPLLIFTFQEFPFSSHLSNMILVPFVAFMLPPFYLILMLRMLPFLEGPFLESIYPWIALPLDGFVWLARKMSDYSVFFEYRSWLNLAFILSLLTMILLMGSVSESRKSGKRNVRLAISLLVLAPVFSIFLEGSFWGSPAGRLHQIQLELDLVREMAGQIL